MPHLRIPTVARVLIVFALGTALPLALVEAKDAPVPTLGKTKKPKVAGPPKPQECKLVETGKSICEKNAQGDEVCQPELVEECPQPL